eukprot:CAMPEP_0168368384 /NCGR_PEP_ID=MMETSP0228-20121227/6223_1 /TAXON_ID=133427 /ORGANISM="Protoceratium reticulatum, Strain CCCM 535 (=CCMP 1889)" /LENGTH=498 /DNA_ID=CAMNT_0008381229 /DNA_START=36 /DNA_END=1532 /DNA_ORIENTATION=-
MARFLLAALLLLRAPSPALTVRQDGDEELWLDGPDAGESPRPRDEAADSTSRDATPPLWREWDNSSQSHSNSFLEQRSKGDCDGHEFKMVDAQPLGQGAYGRVDGVIAVKIDGQPRDIKGESNFAMKTFLKRKGGTDLREISWTREVNAMDQARDCQGIVKLVDLFPCVRGKNGNFVWQEFSMVVQLIPGGKDLWKWFVNSRNTPRISTCFSAGQLLLKSLADQVQCLHIAGLIHQDIKADNIFIQTDDSNECPTHVHLGDLGLAEKFMTEERGTLYSGVFSAKDITRAGHLPTSVFATGDDALHLKQSVHSNHYKMSPKIDWCSFMYMFKQFKLDVANWLAYNNYIKPGLNCGKMGQLRSVWVGHRVGGPSKPVAPKKGVDLLAKYKVPARGNNKAGGFKHNHAGLGAQKVQNRFGQGKMNTKAAGKPGVAGKKEGVKAPKKGLSLESHITGQQHGGVEIKLHPTGHLTPEQESHESFTMNRFANPYLLPKKDDVNH